MLSLVGTLLSGCLFGGEGDLPAAGPETIIDTVYNGDTVRTTCIYENNTNQTIRFGESSEDEMCMNFARYYPKDGMTCGGGLGGLLGGGGGLGGFPR